MKAEKRKKVPSYTYEKIKTPDYQSSPEITKKKIKLQNTSIENGSRVMDALTQATDDGEETIAGTQINVYGEQEVQNKSGNDLSFIGTMNLEEVNNHIQKCLEMSSENKITPKNAFALQLIDCMNLLLKKEDFSVMACTLDAGQKIYAHRVDGLHQQVIKLAEEVINNHKNKRNSGKEDGCEDSDESLKKETRRATKRNILASSESLKRNLKSKDPKEKYIKIDGLPGAITSSVRRDHKDLSFTLKNNVQFWHNWENYKPLTISGTVTIPDCEIYRDRNEIRNKDNLLSNFLETDNTNVSDLIASAEGSSGEMVEDDIVLSDMISEGRVDDEKLMEGEVDVISNAIKRLNEEAKENKDICSIPSRFETMKMIFDQVSDYHYLNMEKAYYWAGPEFWKRSKTTHLESKDKKRVMRKKKDPNTISYTDYVADERINRKLKKAPTLNQKTIKGWKTKNITYAKDLRISVKQFLDLYNMLDFFEVADNSQSSEIEQIFDSEPNSNNNTFENDTSDYSDSQDPLNSCFYENAPENSSSPEQGDPLNSAFYDAGLAQKPETIVTETGKIVKVHFSATYNSDTTLVPAPKIIQFQPIKHKTRPIRVDMQHLKQTMWTVIIEDNDNKEQEKSGKPWSDDPSPEAKFTNILKQLPSRLEKRTAEDLFPGMALLALLTLANENNLKLKNSDDFCDVMISLPNASPAVN